LMSLMSHPAKCGVIKVVNPPRLGLMTREPETP
jgi:hypothetical protein